MPTADRVQALPYPTPEKSGVPALRVPLGLTSLLPTDNRPDPNERAVALAKNRIFELETRLATLEGEIPQVRERGRLEGEEGGRRKQAEDFAEMLEGARQSVVAAIEAFADERKEYFRGVEAEAVKLALAIARKILHRETQMDPMLLRAVVRSAMDRLEETSKVVLRIPPAEASGWERIFAEVPAQERPTVMADPRMQAGGCQIESRMGSIELSVDAQLAEIERGFFDLLHQRLATRQDALPCANCGVEAIQEESLMSAAGVERPSPIRSVKALPGAVTGKHFDPYFQSLAERPAWRCEGRIVEALGQSVRSEGPLCQLGETCEIVDSEGNRHLGEVIGFRGNQVLSMPLDRVPSIRYGNIVAATGLRPRVGVGDSLRGRVLNAMGKPIDGGPPLRTTSNWELDRPPLAAMDRLPISEPLGTGIRAIDGLLTTGCGQRVGIFGGSGVGKSTLIGMMTRNTSADITIVGLIGERGREVREFLEDVLGEEGRSKSVTVVSTSDESPLLRIRAAYVTTVIAEYFAAQGKNVLLVMDSLTRYAMAEREVGLAAGEPPTVRGYTPSVFARLARLVERAGRRTHGSITAFYGVLMEGDDLQDPIVDSVRSLLDGHIMLSRSIAAEGIYPPIAILDSVSRLMSAVTTPEQRQAAVRVRRWMAAYTRSEDLVRIGAYKSGTDGELDQALRFMPAIRRFLEQTSHEKETFQRSLERLHALAMQV